MSAEMALIESQSSATAYAFASHVIRERTGELDEGRLPKIGSTEKSRSKHILSHSSNYTSHKACRILGEQDGHLRNMVLIRWQTMASVTDK